MLLKLIVNHHKKIYDKPMIFIVGLGNPGEQFNYTRHNAGFMVIDFLAKKNQFPNFKLSKKYHALICEKDNIVLVKPQTFMNESGKSVKAILKNKHDASLLVIHDDIDLMLGNIKFSISGGSGGHKGIDSIIQHIASKDFARLKFGINNSTEKVKAEEIVLKKFNSEEKQIIEEMIEKSAQAIDFFIEHGIEKTMNQYN